MASTSSGHLHFRSSPGEFHVGFNTLFLKPAFRDAHAFRGDALALKVFRTGNGGIFRDYQHPAGRLGGSLGVLKIRQHFHVRPVFINPVAPGNAAVDETVIDITAYFLGTDQEELQIVVVAGRAVSAAGHINIVAGLAEQFHGGILQTAFGKSYFEFLRHDGTGMKTHPGLIVKFRTESGPFYRAMSRSMSSGSRGTSPSRSIFSVSPIRTSFSKRMPMPSSAI